MYNKYKIPKNKRTVAYHAIIDGSQRDTFAYKLINYLMAYSKVKAKGHKKHIMHSFFNSKEFIDILKKYDIGLETDDISLHDLLFLNEFFSKDFLKGFEDYEALYYRK